MRLKSTPEGRAQLQSRTVVKANNTVCFTDYYFDSTANGLFVSAELTYTGNDYGLLRARASEVGPWELFINCQYQNTSGQWVQTYQSQANGKFVSTEYTFGGLTYQALRARASTDGTWEHYYRGVPCNWTFDLQTVYIGRYVSVELDYPGTYDPAPGNYKGLLRGRAKDLGPWEIFGTGCF